MMDYFSFLVTQSRGQSAGIRPLFRPRFASSVTPETHAFSAWGYLSAPSADIPPAHASVETAISAVPQHKEMLPPDLVPSHKRQVTLPASLLGDIPTIQQVRQPWSQEIDQDVMDEEIADATFPLPLPSVADEEQGFPQNPFIPPAQENTGEEQDVGERAFPLPRHNAPAQSSLERNAASRSIHDTHEGSLSSGDVRSPDRSPMRQDHNPSAQTDLSPRPTGASPFEAAIRNVTPPQNTAASPLGTGIQHVTSPQSQDYSIRPLPAEQQTVVMPVPPYKPVDDPGMVHLDMPVPATGPSPRSSIQMQVESKERDRSFQKEQREITPSLSQKHQQRIDSRTVQRTRISHPSIVPPLASMQTDARTKGDGSDVKDEAQRPEELPARGLIPRVVVSSADAQQRKSVDLSISEPHGSVANSEQHDAHTSDHATVPASTARARQTQHLEIALPQKETGKLQVESEQPAVPIIRIHIGQVEVRAVPPAPPRQAPRRSEPPRQGLTLNEYMQQRRRDLQ